MQHGKIGLRAATWFNIVLSFVAISALVIMGVSLYKYINRISGLMYAKDMGDYTKHLIDKVKKSKDTMDKVELLKLSHQLQDVVKALNDHMTASGAKVTLPTIDPSKDLVNFVHELSSNLIEFSKNENTQHAFFEGLVGLIKDKNASLNELLPLGNKQVSFAKSLIEFSHYIDFNELTTPIMNRTATLRTIITVLLKGMKKWFIQTNGLFFIGAIMFGVTWLLSIIASICLKKARKKRYLNGGTGLIIGSIFLPVFGFLFYPIISISYTIRKS